MGMAYGCPGLTVDSNPNVLNPSPWQDWYFPEASWKLVALPFQSPGMPASLALALAHTALTSAPIQTLPT